MLLQWYWSTYSVKMQKNFGLTFWGFSFLFVQCLVDVIWIGPSKVYLWFGSEFFEQMIACCGMCVCHVCALFHMMDMWNVLMTERENYFEMNEPLWMLILSWNNYHLVVLELFVCMSYFGGIGDSVSRIYKSSAPVFDEIFIGIKNINMPLKKHYFNVP